MEENKKGSLCSYYIVYVDSLTGKIHFDYDETEMKLTDGFMFDVENHSWISGEMMDESTELKEIDIKNNDHLIRAIERYNKSLEENK